MKRKICCLIVILFARTVFAQDKLDIKFGKISPGDFKLTAQKFDSGANALVIADIGTTSFEGNDLGNFTLVFTRFLRVIILNKNGFDIGDQQILLYHDDLKNAEKITFFKASTFNLENGIVKESKLEDKSIFDDKYNKDYYRRKFTMPALKVGAIYDLQYTIKSPFYSELRSWSFQGKYPCLWSEYEVVVAPPFHYAMKLQGDEHYDIDISKEVDRTYSIREVNGIVQTNLFSYTGEAVYKRWVKKNVPALHEEAFTTNLENYNSRVSFQLNYIQWSRDEEKHEYSTTWAQASKELLKMEDFGQALNQENYWMADELKTLLGQTETAEEKTRRVYEYIRNNFSNVSKEGYRKDGLVVITSLKDVFKTKQGNVAEINLLLTAMLRKAGIKADPLILSTRDHGIANPGYPMINEYNYVICVAYPEGKMVTLDASQPFNGYGQLSDRCYNGWGHIINEENPLPVNFSADSLTESSLTRVILINDEKGAISGAFTRILGKNESNDIRSEVRNSSEEAYRKKVQDEYGTDFTMENFGIDSLKNFEYPLTVHFDFDLKNLSSGDLIYLNPIMDLTYKTNPFVSLDRRYPVEIPYRIDETYVLNMDIPTGYQIDELPKSVRVNLNGSEGMFEYIIQKGESNLQMRVRLKLNKAFFATEEYPTLRDFFVSVVKKESEQIVFKRLK